MTDQTHTPLAPCLPVLFDQCPDGCQGTMRLRGRMTAKVPLPVGADYHGRPELCCTRRRQIREAAARSRPQHHAEICLEGVAHDITQALVSGSRAIRIMNCSPSRPSSHAKRIAKERLTVAEQLHFRIAARPPRGSAGAVTTEVTNFDTTGDAQCLH